MSHNVLNPYNLPPPTPIIVFSDGDQDRTGQRDSAADVTDDRNRDRYVHASRIHAATLPCLQTNQFIRLHAGSVRERETEALPPRPLLTAGEPAGWQ